MSYMVNKNNPDIYISAIGAIKKRLVNGNLSYGFTPCSTEGGSVLWLYPYQRLSGICLMVVPLSVAIGDLSNGCTPGSAQADYE